MKNSLIKRIGLTLASLAVRAIGSMLMATGLVMSIWYVFFSTSDYRYVIIAILFLLVYADYSLIKFSFEKMHNEFDIHY
ncbi:hypothetical protein [uncultured Pantoea sp.]|uniref:hypothetical protein n=1 Tax=uncultured Pantoea sp. TaxID=218084 RepID=UPI00374863C8